VRVGHESWARDPQIEFTVDLRPGENVHDVEIDRDR
jgi:hypothetical protein